MLQQGWLQRRRSSMTCILTSALLPHTALSCHPKHVLALKYPDTRAICSHFVIAAQVVPEDLTGCDKIVAATPTLCNIIQN